MKFGWNGSPLFEAYQFLMFCSINSIIGNHVVYTFEPFADPSLDLVWEDSTTKIEDIHRFVMVVLDLSKTKKTKKTCNHVFDI